MKILGLLLMLTLYACNDKEPTSNKADRLNSEATSSNNSSNSIAEENDACICTKDWRPVCGDNGVTYPNACQAECEKVKNYSEGACSK
jgi:hypothetical protein